MSNPTSNFGWQMPTSTDLVTDLPADFEVFGQAVDTDFVDLLGGTTGQILSKTSATDLDFTWVSPNAGDITGVTAGTGISGGGTSGTVTVTNDMATTITAAGDIVVGTGSGTYDNLPIGTTNQVLTADTTVSPYKVKWASPASSLQILQIVQATYDTETASTSGTLADTGLTASITPSSASNKILVLCTQGGLGKTATGQNDNAITMQLNRGGTDIVKITGYAAYTGTNLEVNIGNTGISYLDAPNTTSATIYKTRFKREGTGGSAKVQIDNSTSVMTLLEITGV